MVAIILQRSGDVALLSNPGPIDFNLPKKHLHFGQANINSLRNKTHEVKALLVDSGIHFLGITETKLDDSVLDGSLAIEGYQLIIRNRNGQGGGVGLYYKDIFVCREREDMTSPDIEALWVEIHRPQAPIMLLGIYYCPPDANRAYMTHVFDSWEKATDENKETYILGDFNKNWFNEVDSARVRSYANICCLTQTVTQPTRTVRTACSTTSTCLDLIFTNRVERCKCKVIQLGFTDHDLTVLSMKTKIPKGPTKVVIKRSYKYFSKDKFLKELKYAPFWLVGQTRDVNEALDIFIKLFTDIADSHAPLRKFSVKTKSAPWLTDNIRDLMLLRDESKFEARASGLLSDWAVYRKLRNHVVKLNRESKREYFLDAINNSRKDPKSMWNTINNLLGRSKYSTPSSIESNGLILTKPKDIANYFAKYFEEKVLKYRSDMSDPIDMVYVTESIDKIMAGKDCHFEFTSLNLSEVKKCLDNPPKSKAVGVDTIDNYLLKIASDIIAEPIRYILNCSFVNSTFPDKWKIAKLHPIPKDKKKPLEDVNSRPISLLNVLSKLHEKSAFQQIRQYLSDHKIMLMNQHGYRNNHSTETALIQLTDSCLENMEHGLITGIALLDFSAAFDLVDHNLLLLKLKSYNFSDCALNWIKSYLSGRTMSVCINAAYSDPTEMVCGVPQGSCLGPLLFSLFINDLPTVLTTSDIMLYADDSSPYQSAKSARLVSDNLQHDLVNIEKWIEKNRLVLNAGKSKCILIGSRQRIKTAQPLNLKMKDTSITQLACVKLLGIQIDETLSWKPHCETLLKNCSKALGLLYRFSKYMPIKVLKQVAEALILSKLSYCCTVWGSALNQDSLNYLQKLQNKVARLILGHRVDEISRIDLHSEIRWLTVRQKIYVRTIMILHGALHTGEPITIHMHLHPLEVLHGHETRFSLKCNNDKFLITPDFKRKTFLARAFRTRAIEIWNFLNSETREISSKSLFKSALCKQLHWFI